MSPGYAYRVFCVPLISLLLILPLSTLSGGSVLPEQSKESSKQSAPVEEYQYEAVPISNREDKEQINAVLSFENDGVVLSSHKVSRQGEERIVLKMTPEGELISGTRSFTDSSRRSTEGRIWRDENKVYTEETSPEGPQTTSHEIPKGSILATEGSVIVLLRSFPYESSRQWQLFIIDFSGKTVTGTAGYSGTDRINVPAGSFTCYRIEVVFRVLVLNPKVICWFAREKPHVLVKSVGKRGLLTPTYVTSLVRQKTPPIR